MRKIKRRLNRRMARRIDGRLRDRALLRGVDPHDPDLSPEIKAAIIQECGSNLWYFFRVAIGSPHILLNTIRG